MTGVKGERNMTKGPNGEKRPADAIGCAVTVARIATGEERDAGYVSKNRRKSGVAGAEARMRNTNAAQRSLTATVAAETRWKKEAKMNDCAVGSLALLYEGKRKNEGLVDVKFLHKNLDEASPAQVEADLLKIQKAILSGKTEKLDFGDLRWKKAD